MRGSGVTSNQILNAPQAAVFVWVNHDLRYPKDLQRKLDRMDLQIVGPMWLIDGWKGQFYSDIIVDHACILNYKQLNGLSSALYRCMR